MEDSSMKIKNKTKERLLGHGKMGQSFDELINLLLDRVERREQQLRDRIARRRKK